jgi:WD40 repeat protein
MAVLACTPHPGFGAVSVRHGARVTVVDLATCREVTRRAQPTRAFVVPGLTTRGQSLVYGGRTVFTERLRGNPVLPLGLSPDRRWAFFSVDRFGSASVLQDGLPVRVVATRGGQAHALPAMLLDGTYRTWCGGRLVLTAGDDRYAWTHKRLVVTAPPGWRVRPLVRAPGRAFGASTCAPDGRSIVVQSQPESASSQRFAARWTLWRVGLDGRAAQLTHPPRGAVDESPRYAPDGTLYFVRSRRGRGRLFALRRGRVVGPLLALGYAAGVYGRRDWPYAVRR